MKRDNGNRDRFYLGGSRKGEAIASKVKTFFLEDTFVPKEGSLLLVNLACFAINSLYTSPVPPHGLLPCVFFGFEHHKTLVSPVLETLDRYNIQNRGRGVYEEINSDPNRNTALDYEEVTMRLLCNNARFVIPLFDTRIKPMKNNNNSDDAIKEATRETVESLFEKRIIALTYEACDNE